MNRLSLILSVCAILVVIINVSEACCTNKVNANPFDHCCGNGGCNVFCCNCDGGCNPKCEANAHKGWRGVGDQINDEAMSHIMMGGWGRKKRSLDHHADKFEVVHRLKNAMNLFNQYDSDKNFKISVDEALHAMNATDMSPCDKHRFEKLFLQSDKNGNGHIDPEEFDHHLTPRVMHHQHPKHDAEIEILKFFH